jgi:hypothetical protein
MIWPCVFAANVFQYCHANSPLHGDFVATFWRNIKDLLQLPMLTACGA